MLVRLLEYVSDGFISAAIAKVSGYLNLSEPMAGATLLAFSNGASDVITAVVAGGDEGSDDLVMGSLFGAAIFTMLICLGIIVLSSEQKKVENLQRVRFAAVLSTYLLTVALLCSVGGLEMNYIYLGTIFFLIYIIYLCVLHIQDVRDRRTMIHTLSIQLSQLQIENQLDDNMRQSLLKQLEEVKSKPRPLTRSFKVDELLDELPNVDENSSILVQVFGKIHHQMHHNWSQRNIALKVLFLVECPIYFVIQLTVPPVEHQMLFRMQQYIYPFTSIAFALWSQELIFDNITVSGTSIPYGLIGLAVSVMLTILIALRSRHSYKPTPRGIFLALTIAVGFCWLDFLVSIAIDIIAYVRLWTGASDLYLGMTFLGIGNSSVDCFVNYLLAKRGYEVMAITGIFSGQMFNLLVGFGLACLTKGLKNHHMTYHVFDWDSLLQEKSGFMVFLIFVTCAIVLIFYSIALPTTKYTFGISMGYIVMIGYAVVLTMFTLIEVLWK